MNVWFLFDHRSSQSCWQTCKLNLSLIDRHDCILMLPNNKLDFIGITKKRWLHFELQFCYCHFVILSELNSWLSESGICFIGAISHESKHHLTLLNDGSWKTEKNLYVAGLGKGKRAENDRAFTKAIFHCLIFRNRTWICNKKCLPQKCVGSEVCLRRFESQAWHLVCSKTPWKIRTSGCKQMWWDRNAYSVYNNEDVETRKLGQQYTPHKIRMEACRSENTTRDVI